MTYKSLIGINKTSHFKNKHTWGIFFKWEEYGLRFEGRNEQSTCFPDADRPGESDSKRVNWNQLIKSLENYPDGV